MRDYGTTNNTPAHQAPPVWRAPEGLEDLTAAQVGDGGACQHTNDKPDRSGAPRGLRGLAGHHTDTPTDWRPPRGLRGLAAVPVGGGRAWPGFEKTRRANHQHTRLHWCGGHRRELPRCRRAAAGPGRVSRSTTPSTARGTDGERAGRRPPAHTAARPNKTSHAAAGPSQASRSTTLNRTLTRHTRCRWAAAGPGRASRSTTPSEARVWRSRGRGAAHRHQHAGTNTQPQTHRHNEAARPHRGRAAHASGR